MKFNFSSVIRLFAILHTVIFFSDSWRAQYPIPMTVSDSIIGTGYRRSFEGDRRRSGETAGRQRRRSGETAGRQRRRSGETKRSTAEEMGETKKFILFSSSDDVAAKLASVPVNIRRVFQVDAHWTSMEPCQQLG